jgi:hypothetical protein
MVTAVAPLALSLLIPGCASEAESDEGEEVAEEALTAVDPSRPIVLHYGFLQDTPVARSGAKPSPNGALTSRLRARGVENVLVTTSPTTDPDVRAWGGRVAFRATPAALTKASAAEVAAYVREKIAAGYSYVALDEIEPSKAGGLRNGTPGATALVEAMRVLDQEPRHAKRIILMVNTYNMAGLRKNELPSFSTILRACRDHCRVLGAEVYLRASEAFAPGAPSASTCDSGIRCVGFLAAKLDEVAPGLEGKTITILDVRGQGNLPGGDLGSYCWGPRGGALRAEIAKVRELRQPGVGFYALTYVAADLDGAGERAQFDDAVKKFAGCARALIDDRPWPTVAR